MNIGNKIKELRNKNNLTQEELAGRCELSKGFISQIERDLTSPSIATLVDILEVLGTNLNNFFSDDEEEQVVFTKKDYFILENAENNIINWIIPNAQKNNMEPILLELKKNSKTKTDISHEGEEFGYVLEGKIELMVGNKKYIVRKGESFYYKSNKNHSIKNIYDGESKIIWISSPPSF